MIQKITCFCLLLFLSFSVFSQSEGFERIYRLQDDIEHLTLDGVTTPDGGWMCLSIVTESDSATYKSINLVKLDQKGGVDWSKDYVVEDSLELMREGDLNRLSDNRYGISVSLGRDSLSQILFVTDNNGNVEWSRRYGVMDSLGADRYTPRIKEFHNLIDTTLYHAGAGIVDSINTNYISGLRNDGTIKWAHQIAKPTSDTTFSNLHISDFTLSREGGIAIVGVDEDSMQFYISRVDTAGMLMWNRQISNPGLVASRATATGIVQLPDSSYVIMGKLFTLGVEFDGFIIKTDSTGVTQWSKKVDFENSINDVHLNDIIVGADATLMISARQIGVLDTVAIGMKMDFDGNVLWQSKFKSVSTTDVDLGGLDFAFNGNGMAFFTTGGSSTGDEEFIPNLIVADSLGMTMCNDTITMNIVTDDAFVSDTLELVVMPYEAMDTVSLTTNVFSEFDVPIVVLAPGVFCSNEAWSHEMNAFQEDATHYVWTDGEDVIGLADSLVVTEEGQYDVTVFMGGSYCFILCDTVNVEEFNLPEMSLFPSEPFFCSQGLMTANAFPNAEAGVDSITWSTGETGNSINVSMPGTYSATLTDNCGLTVESSIDIVFPVLVSGISLEGDVNTLCDMGAYSLAVTIDPADAPVTSITWSTGTSMNELSTLFNMDGTYSVTVTDYCMNEFVESITFADLPTLAPTNGVIVSSCLEDNVTLQLVADVDASHQIEWSSGEMDVTSINVDYGTGPYTVSITDFCGNVSTATFDLANLPNSIPDDLIVVGDCNEGGPVLSIEGSVGNVETITWSTGATSETIQVPFGTGPYTVTVTDFCRNEDVLTFDLDDLPKIGPDVEEKQDCQETGVLLQLIGDVGEVISYEWSTGETTPTIIADFDTGGYSVTVTDICNNESVVDFDKTSKCVPITFPNVFLPDHREGDEEGVNATFGPYVTTPEEISNYELSIYNRWGEKVFESVDFEEGWDGIYKDTPQPGDVYLFYAKYNVFGREITEQADLTLLR